MSRLWGALALGLTIVSLGTADATGSPPSAGGGRPAGARHGIVKAKAAPAGAFAQSGPMREDDWFSFGPPKEAEIEKEAPGVQIKVHDPQEEDIIVYGVRQRRDFEGATPSPNLTSPQGLEAAQPAFVPNMGDSCSYKYGCFDMSQTPLRSAAPSLLGD